MLDYEKKNGGTPRRSPRILSAQKSQRSQRSPTNGGWFLFSQLC